MSFSQVRPERTITEILTLHTLLLHTIGVISDQVPQLKSISILLKNLDLQKLRICITCSDWITSPTLLSHWYFPSPLLPPLWLCDCFYLFPLVSECLLLAAPAVGHCFVACLFKSPVSVGNIMRTLDIVRAFLRAIFISSSVGLWYAT